MADYASVGNSGLQVSRLGLGCNNFGRSIDYATASSVVHAAVSEGVTLFDTAESYGESESILGKALGKRRGEIVLATKFGFPTNADDPRLIGAGSRRYICRAVERSLRALETDWIDLYQLHFPDLQTPIDETLAALTDLIRTGKVRYIGCSNMTSWQVTNAIWTARSLGTSRFVSLQAEYSFLNRSVETDIVPMCQTMGVGLVPYFPLGSGLLTGKYRRHSDPPTESRIAKWGWSHLLTKSAFDRIEALEKFARERSVGLLAVALGGLASQPGVSAVLAGATSAEQVNANVQAIAWQPTAADLCDLDTLAPRGKRVD